MEVKKMAAVRLDRIGDLILTTPALASLRKSFPQSRVTAIVSRYNAAVLEHSELADEIWPWRGTLEEIRRLRRERFDLVAVFSPTTASYGLAFLSGARVRAGYVYSSRLFPRLLTRIWLNRRLVCGVDQKDLEHRELQVPHEVEQNLAVVRALAGDCVILPELCVPVPDAERAWAREALRGKRAVGIHLSRAWRSGLPDDFLPRLMDGILPHVTVFVTYGPFEKGWTSSLHLPPSVLEFDSLNFARWAALYREARLVISPNTGALHLAASQKVPVLAVFEPRFYSYHVQRWRPWQVPHRILRKDNPDLLTQLKEAALEFLDGSHENFRSDLQP